MQSWLVCYDICDKKRLRKVATCCEDFGERRLMSDSYISRPAALKLPDPN